MYCGAIKYMDLYFVKHFKLEIVRGRMWVCPALHTMTMSKGIFFNIATEFSVPVSLFSGNLKPFYFVKWGLFLELR